MTKESIDNFLRIICPDALGDLISLEDAIEEIASADITDGTKPVFSGRQVIEMLKGLDTIKPQEPKTGRWIQATRPFNFRFKCSECGRPALKNGRNGNDVKSKYCPRCGARMESEEQT